jgi:hypothetical protein
MRGEGYEGRGGVSMAARVGYVPLLGATIILVAQQL